MQGGVLPLNPLEPPPKKTTTVTGISGSVDQDPQMENIVAGGVPEDFRPFLEIKSGKKQGRGGETSVILIPALVHTHIP